MKYHWSSSFRDEQEQFLKDRDAIYTAHASMARLPSHRRKTVLLCLAVVVVLVVISVSTVLVYTTKRSAKCRRNDFPFGSAAVASDSETCSEVGCKILLRGGTAADAAVATTLCIGLSNMHSSGIGGGGFALFYQRETRTPTFIDFREVAPLYPNVSVYENQSEDLQGPLSIAVPGLIKGLHTLWKTYGRLSWGELVEPAIEMASDGFKITKALSDAINVSRLWIQNNPVLRDMFKSGSEFLKTGNLARSPLMAKTLSLLRDNPELFYKGVLAELISRDIQKAGGVLSVDDLSNYTVKTRTVGRSQVMGYDVLSTSAPSTGAILVMILNMIEACNISKSYYTGDEARVAFTMVEAFKWAYGRRGMLGDPDFLSQPQLDQFVKETMSVDTARHLCEYIVRENMSLPSPSNYTNFYVPKEHGTSHVSIVDTYGNAISMTTSINAWFGSRFSSESTGILFNNHMDDFSFTSRVGMLSLLPNPNNFVRPGKKPLSSMCPTIILNQQGDVTMVIGASGGTMITSVVAQVIANRLILGRTLRDAIAAPRLHNQLTPYVVLYEEKNPVPQTVITALKSMGNLVLNTTLFASCQAIFIGSSGAVEAETDPRKPSCAYGF